VPSKSKRFYQFDSITFDPDRRTIEKNQITKTLEPKASALLEYLIQNKEDVVSKQRIFDSVWKDTFVTDNTLTVCIHQIRKALDAMDHQEHKYIKCIPKGGYCFIGTVEEIYSSTTRDKAIDSLEYEFLDQYCDSSSIRYICALGDFALEKIAHVSETLLVERMGINQKIIKYVKIKQEPDDKECLTGYYILYPISRECEELLNKGLLAGSSKIKNHHICAGYQQASALYLSMVYGKNRRTRAFLVYLLKRDIAEILSKNGNIKGVYTRPCTPEGVRAAIKNQLHQLPNNPQIYKYIIGQV